MGFLYEKKKPRLEQAKPHAGSSTGLHLAAVRHTTVQVTKLPSYRRLEK